MNITAQAANPTQQAKQEFHRSILAQALQNLDTSHSGICTPDQIKAETARLAKGSGYPAPSNHLIAAYLRDAGWVRILTYNWVRAEEVL
jgi:hypothetical protein